MGMNSLANAKNPYQGNRKKVLAVCSAGLLRSPTIAWILSTEPFDYNTRACGITEEYALIPISDVLVHWADEIVVVEEYMADRISKMPNVKGKKIHVIETPDRYETRDPKLIAFLTPKLMEIFLENTIA
jgi:predicted protein tyrosine phosphatase